MSKPPKKTRRKATINRSPGERTPRSGFDEVMSLIDAAKARAVVARKMALIELYWSITALFDQRCQRCQGQAVSQCFLTESPRNGLTRQEKIGPAYSLDDQSIASNGIFCTMNRRFSILSYPRSWRIENPGGLVTLLPLSESLTHGEASPMSGSWPEVIHDPVHDIIPFHETPCDKLLLSLIETAEFQRLRRIKQLGMSELVFPGANHNRFAHSLGVMSLARRFLSSLEREGGTLPEEQQIAVLTASLLHDIGHGPFSHTFEKVTGESHKAPQSDHLESRDRGPQTPGLVRPEPSRDARLLLR